MNLVPLCQKFGRAPPLHWYVTPGVDACFGDWPGRRCDVGDSVHPEDCRSAVGGPASADSDSDAASSAAPDQQFLRDRIGLNVTAIKAGGREGIGAQEAKRIALAHEAAGSSSEGTVVVQVESLRSGNTCVCWIVAIHPSSPLRANSPSDTAASNFDFHTIDAMTGLPTREFSLRCIGDESPRYGV